LIDVQASHRAGSTETGDVIIAPDLWMVSEFTPNKSLFFYFANRCSFILLFYRCSFILQIVVLSFRCDILVVSAMTVTSIHINFWKAL